MREPSPSTNFVTEELWVYTDGTATESWVEVGMTHGYNNTNDPNNTGRRMFWADERAVYGYSEHDIPASVVPAWVGRTYTFGIKDMGTSTWGIWIDALRVGTSTNNSSPSYSAEAGEEITSTVTQAAAKFTNFQYIDLDGSFHTDWPRKEIHADKPAVISENTDGSYWAFSNWLCGESTPAHALNEGAKSQGSGSMIDASAAMGLARRLAIANGVDDPTSVRYVLTTAGALPLTAQPGVDSARPTYIVEMKGQFTGRTAKVPRRGSRPTGSVLTVAVDAVTGDRDSYSISNIEGNLARLGEVHIEK